MFAGNRASVAVTWLKMRRAGAYLTRAANGISGQRKRRRGGENSRYECVTLAVVVRLLLVRNCSLHTASKHLNYDRLSYYLQGGPN